MTSVAICSAKHSPGATTLALALAARSGAMLIEADPSGGDLAARWGLSLDPGLLTLAAASRRGLDSDLIERHTQITEAGYRLLAAPPSAEQCRSALLSLGAAFASTVRTRVSETASEGLDSVADCGRWDPNGPSVDLVREADVALLVLRPSIETVAHTRSRLASLVPLARMTVVVCIGNRPYDPAEVSAALGDAPTLAIADDRSGADHLAGGRGIDRVLRRTSLVRSLDPLLAMLTEPMTFPTAATKRMVPA